MKAELKGGRELERALRALSDPKEIRRASLKALRKGAEPIRDKAQELAPDDPATGAGRFLKESIAIQAGKKQTEAGTWMLIGIDDSVDPPVVRPRKRGKGSYRDPGVAGNSVFQEFGTSKMAANPFMTPAWDQEKDATPQRIADELGPAIEASAKRLARQ